MVKMWEKMKAAFWSLNFLLQMCGADVVVLDCRVTRNGSRMLYQISNEAHPLDFKEAQCDYFWDNGDIQLVINNDTQSTKVMRLSFSYLETSQCLSSVSWTKQCWSKMKGHIDYSANCSTSCSSRIFLHTDTTTPNPREKDGQSSVWIGPCVGIMVLLGLIGLIIILCNKDKIPRIHTCSLFGRLYSVVQREKDDPGQSNV